MDMGTAIMLAYWIVMAGAITQCFLAVRGKKIDGFRKKLGEVLVVIIVATVVLTLVAIFESPKEGNPVTWVDALDPAAYLFTAMFVIIFYSTFKNEIAPRINEGAVLLLTIVFWFVVLTHNTAGICIGAWTAALAFTGGALFMAFTSIRATFWQKVLFYVWFVAMMVLIIFSQVEGWRLPEAGSGAGTGISLVVVQLFLFGMTLSYLFGYATYLIEFMPQRGEHKDAYRKRMDKHTNMMAGNFSDKQIAPIHAIIMILVVGGGLALNHVVNIVPDYLLLNFFLVVGLHLTGDELPRFQPLEENPEAGKVRKGAAYDFWCYLNRPMGIEVKTEYTYGKTGIKKEK